MRAYWERIGIALGMVFLLSGTGLGQGKTPKEIAREISQAVVVLEAVDEAGGVIGQGSGFLVSPNGAIVSNLHVVQGAAMVRVKLPSGDVYKTVDVVEFDDAKDIVILKIKKEDNIDKMWESKIGRAHV